MTALNAFSPLRAGVLNPLPFLELLEPFAIWCPQQLSAHCVHILYHKVSNVVGGVISCILSNVYLHYVLDIWFEKRVKRACLGEAQLVRYVDDFVACFQYKEDADNFGS